MLEVRELSRGVGLPPPLAVLRVVLRRVAVRVVALLPEPRDQLESSRVLQRRAVVALVRRQPRPPRASIRRRYRHAMGPSRLGVTACVVDGEMVAGDVVI